MSTRKISWITLSAIVAMLSAVSSVRADETYSGGVTVDIDYEIEGYLYIEDATVNLLKNAHIKNADYYGDIWATSGSILNIYGGQIDGYAYVTTTYDELPEAQVTVFGSNFAIDGVPVEEGTTEVFLQAQELTGLYQDGTPFAHWVDCFSEGGFYLTIKLGWIVSKSEMEVAPSTLDFGQVKVGQSVTQTVTVTNTGNANLSLQAVAMAENSNPDFAITPLAQLPLTVEPGQIVEIEVVFTPTAAGQVLGVLQVTSDDADTPVINVVLSGIATTPVIAVEPASLDFGQMDVGAIAAKDVTIANDGDAELVVQSIAWADGGNVDFAIAVLPEMPLVIEPGSAVVLSIMYTPTVEGTAAAVLEIVSDDPKQPVVSLAVAGGAVNTALTPYDQIKTIIAFYDASVKDGTIYGVGHGRSATAHVKIIRDVLKVTKSMIYYKHDKAAIAVLKQLDKFTDGKFWPRDLIAGDAVAQLNADIETLIVALKAD